MNAYAVSKPIKFLARGDALSVGMLPDAPLAMPRQMLERNTSLGGGLFGFIWMAPRALGIR